jgi:EAL domain-containing protein (putative c-di-GMP-specific phosphodiesterase class I)
LITCSPLEFIPIAEENGLIATIGNWVIEEACTQNKAWQESGVPLMRMAVNVSSIQFNDKNFVDNVEQILNKLQLEPEFLELEITESVMQDIEESAFILKQLGKIGVKTSIDDFGTGYSSLSVLSRLPVDFVKIDKSFIDEIVTNSNTASLVNIIIDIGKKLKFELIAEGIENKQQASYLNVNGCHFGQGYLYSPPLPAEEVETFIEKQLIYGRP